MKKPEWISDNTLIDTINHPNKKVWLEEHRNLVNDERLFLVNESGAEPEIYSNFSDAYNAIGAKYGFNEFWKKF
jgi:hypothetical protein